MDLLERRRLMNTKEQIEDVNVELPEYFRFDFTTTQADEQLHVGYYAMSNAKGAPICILDGVQNNSLMHNGSDAYITIPTAGDHVLYLRVYTPYSNSSYRIDIRGVFSYVRIPYTYSSSSPFGLGNGTNTLSAEKIDILPSDRSPGRGYSWYYSSLGDIRVPVGSLSYYKTVYGTQGASSGARWWSAKTNSIKEANFIYTTS